MRGTEEEFISKKLDHAIPFVHALKNKGILSTLDDQMKQCRTKAQQEALISVTLTVRTRRMLGALCAVAGCTPGEMASAILVGWHVTRGTEDERMKYESRMSDSESLLRGQEIPGYIKEDGEYSINDGYSTFDAFKYEGE